MVFFITSGIITIKAEQFVVGVLYFLLSILVLVPHRHLRVTQSLKFVLLITLFVVVAGISSSGKPLAEQKYEHFAHGDLKTKTQILDALDSNLTINNKNILINGHKHFFIIEKGKKDLEILVKKLEPIKWLELLAQKDLPEAFRTSWLRELDQVRTYFMNV